MNWHGVERDICVNSFCFLFYYDVDLTMFKNLLTA